VSLNHRDVRPGMDVYTLDNVYLGSVVQVEPGPQSKPRSVEATSAPGSTVSGEALGPMPTAPLGNRGPISQSAASAYGTEGASEAIALGKGRLRMRLWLVNLSPRTFIPRTRWIPLDLVQTVSLERVVLRVTGSDLQYIEAQDD
jgi:hypothetical protein